jgi:hypothetical protein
MSFVHIIQSKRHPAEGRGLAAADRRHITTVVANALSLALYAPQTRRDRTPFGGVALREGAVA